ncbi:MAG: hypothetical protein ACE5F8_03980 [Woeseiaceae bacterium]
MERLLQIWDDLDDVAGALFLYAENIRRLFLFALYTSAVMMLQLGGILLALLQPPLAMAAATILGVCLMYRSVTHPRPDQALKYSA